MNKAKKISKETEKKLIEEYDRLMSTGTFKTGTAQEWSEKGDQIEKFTIYENYTPVKTSSGTGTIV
jgi:hypothetical protein